MSHRCLRAVPILVLLAPCVAVGAGEFLEPEVVVLQSFVGDEGSFGWAVSEVGDLDGDGARDALTGAPFHNAGGMSAGRAYALSSGSGAVLFEWTGEAGDALGYAVAEAGDVDGDGVSDVLAGAPGGPMSAGRVFLYAGASGAELHEFVGEAAGAGLGSAVAGAGDLDGDGVDDLLLGAERFSGTAEAAGRVYAISGATFATIWTRDGDAMKGHFGSGVAGLGDVDGDGVGDAVVGARGAGPAGKGRVYVLSGVDGADLYAPREADASGANLGHFFVAGVGDLDGDGAGEVYGGDYGDNETGPASGKAYVWSGRTGTRLYTFVGEKAGDGLGCGRGGGDADHDGVPDLAIGSYNASPGGAASAGLITLFSGATGAKIRTISGVMPGHQIGFDVVTLGDVDADGSDDLVLSGANGNRVYVVAGLAPAGGESSGSSGADSEGSSGGAPTTGASGGTSSGGGGTSGGGTSSGGTSGGGASSGAGASGEGSSSDGGCGCRSGGSAAGPGLLVVVAWLGRRRGARRAHAARAGRGAC